MQVMGGPMTRHYPLMDFVEHLAEAQNWLETAERHACEDFSDPDTGEAVPLPALDSALRLLREAVEKIEAARAAIAADAAADQARYYEDEERYGDAAAY